MDNTREKLVELLSKAKREFWCNREKCNGTEYVADYLIANGVTVQEWISVKDRLPPPNKLVLCWWQSGDGEKEHYGFATFQSHGVWYVSNEGMPEVTHWMPLPEPPNT